MAEHGMRESYRKGCRCEPCMEAGQSYLATKRERDARRRARAREARESGNLSVDNHGIGGYQKGCRCEVCSGASRERSRVSRARDLVPPDWSEVEHLRPGAGVRRRSEA